MGGKKPLEQMDISALAPQDLTRLRASSCVTLSFFKKAWLLKTAQRQWASLLAISFSGTQHADAGDRHADPFRYAWQGNSFWMHGSCSPPPLTSQYPLKPKQHITKKFNNNNFEISIEINTICIFERIWSLSLYIR